MELRPLFFKVCILFASPLQALLPNDGRTTMCANVLFEMHCSENFSLKWQPYDQLLIISIIKQLFFPPQKISLI